MSDWTLLNLNAYSPGRVLDPRTGAPITYERLAEVLPPSLAEMELLDRPTLSVPADLRDAFSSYRPTPVLRADRFAEAIGNDCTVFAKDEGTTPSGNHKMNSALWIAYHCAQDGIKTITTETTGNWGLALAMAAARFDLRVVCFMDEASAAARPDRERLMRDAGAEVVVVGPDDAEADFDPLVLSADRAVTYTRARDDARYIFGSVYNYFILPQTLTGTELRRQLADQEIDVVVGSCGGGANLLGVSAAFLAQRVETGRGPDILSAESDMCPIITKGVPGEYSIDGQGFYPSLRTYGLDRLLGAEYIGGLGSTIVAAPVAHFHEQGLIRGITITAEQAAEAAQLFARTEGRRVALETGYQLAAVIEEARRIPGRRLLVTVSSVGERSYA
ncbi:MULTISPECIES: pyridoxal-phosphate dependent enzyme [Nocardia]|jgi:tryptophan synthase beta chain|uniref:pyridoxal-phosphate dependent enzyme n=1 Tax=Nocardia abscessus TaxID=120957 RepID=UPI001894E074|nr:pyridoxal-phosphate dependent enzyme [Nocardia abscessus]MBF6476464.1 pyridoxal-phosphate dependent enzyme [Nocardia abscessus]